MIVLITKRDVPLRRALDFWARAMAHSKRDVAEAARQLSAGLSIRTDELNAGCLHRELRALSGYQGPDGLGAPYEIVEDRTREGAASLLAHVPEEYKDDTQAALPYHPRAPRAVRRALDKMAAKAAKKERRA